MNIHQHDGGMGSSAKRNGADMNQLVHTDSDMQSREHEADIHTLDLEHESSTMTTITTMQMVPDPAQDV